MKNNFDDILIQALERHDAGESLEKIYAAFPNEAAELRRMFQLTTNLHQAGESIKPPSREAFRSMMNRAAAHAAGQNVLAARPAAARWFERIPFSLRIVTPALAAVLILVVADHSQLFPGAGTPNPASPAGTIAENTSPAEQPSVAPGAAAPQRYAATAMPVTPPPTPPNNPSGAANQLTNAFLDNADSEQNNYDNTSAANQAASQDDSSAAQNVASPT